MGCLCSYLSTAMTTKIQISVSPSQTMTYAYQTHPARPNNQRLYSVEIAANGRAIREMRSSATASACGDGGHLDIIRFGYCVVVSCFREAYRDQKK